MAPSDQHTGGCLCGAIRYRMTGDAVHTNICHCTQCQRQTGSLIGAFATFPVDHFELLRGEPASYRASDFATRQFCAGCGSTLFWRADGAPEIDCFLGTLDRPDRMPKPADQLWTQHRVPWFPEQPEIKAYRRSRQEG